MPSANPTTPLTIAAAKRPGTTEVPQSFAINAVV